jgi:hypothetical protein
LHHCSDDESIIYGPIKELLSEENPTQYYAKDIGTSALSYFKL